MNKDIKKKNGYRGQYCAMMERRQNFIGYVCRTQNDRLIEQVVFGAMDGKNKRRRPKKRRTDDLLVNWCNKNIGTLHRRRWTGRNRVVSWNMSWTL